jgi:hypothetical protein
VAGVSHLANAQRFLRQGFNGQEDFAAEMRLDDEMGATDMSREMFLIKDLNIQLPALTDLSAIPDQALRQHVQKYLGKGPVGLKLLKRRGRYGLKAIAFLPGINHNKRLRAFWRQAATPTGASRTDFTRASYDDAVRARLPLIEFHVQLPPIRQRGGESSSSLPTVVYQVPLDSGTINPKCLVPRTTGRVHVRKDDQEFLIDEMCHIGTSPTRIGVVDPSWARGRAVFRSGRKSGL